MPRLLAHSNLCDARQPQAGSSRIDVDEGSATNPVGRTHPRLSGQLVGLENNRALPPRRTIWLASLI